MRKVKCKAPHATPRPHFNVCSWGKKAIKSARFRVLKARLERAHGNLSSMAGE